MKNHHVYYHNDIIKLAEKDNLSVSNVHWAPGVILLYYQGKFGGSMETSDGIYFEDFLNATAETRISFGPFLLTPN